MTGVRNDCPSLSRYKFGITRSDVGGKTTILELFPFCLTSAAFPSEGIKMPLPISKDHPIDIEESFTMASVYV